MGAKIPPSKGLIFSGGFGTIYLLFDRVPNPDFGLCFGSPPVPVGAGEGGVFFYLTPLKNATALPSMRMSFSSVPS
jgi:hypothetical protein